MDRKGPWACLEHEPETRVHEPVQAEFSPVSGTIDREMLLGKEGGAMAHASAGVWGEKRFSSWTECLCSL